MCGMVKPSFIPPADIRELRDLVRYRYKLTCMITGKKNRAQNCLTVSNLNSHAYTFGTTINETVQRVVIEFVCAVIYTYDNGKDRVYFGPVARNLN